MSDGAMSEAGNPVKRALQSFGSAVGNAVQQQCSSEKKGEGRGQSEGGERRRKGACSCKARCSCRDQVLEGKVEPQLILLQILG